MSLLAHTALLAALVAGEHEVVVRLRAPVVDAASAPSSTTPTAVQSRGPIPYDDVVPGPPRPEFSIPPQSRKLGTNTTIFVNFDGVQMSYCNPSNSHENCSWFESSREFPPFSGGLAQRVAILDAMRSQVSPFGVRVTGARPPADEPYLMVVYGGEREEEDEPLGRAPAGDCYDDLPNEVAYVYLDGENERTWVNGGASTALHEAAHTWGLDHIGLEGLLMAPAGDNTKANYFDGCAQVVDNVDLDPVEETSCPSISLDLCGLADFQNDVALLNLLFGEPYVDDIAPRMELLQPFDGIYYQGPVSFRVDIQVIDDLHPQVYEVAIEIEDLVEQTPFAAVYDPSFDVEELPLGEWRFVVRLRDEAGNEDSLAFTVVVGDQPPLLDDGCACRSTGQGGWGMLGLLLLGWPVLRVRRSREREGVQRGSPR
jgi:MYXO-CTERM domain-containing protein